MPRLNLALVAALLAAAAPALASEQELVGLDYIGFDYTPAPSIPIAATGDRTAQATPGWEPLDAATYAGGYAFLEGTLDPIALIEPGPGPDPTLVAAATAAPARTAVGVAAAGGTTQQLLCSCPSK